jgi:hypothetical protein
LGGKEFLLGHLQQFRITKNIILEPVTLEQRLELKIRLE